MELSETETVMWWVISQIQTKLQMNLSSTTYKLTAQELLKCTVGTVVAGVTVVFL